MAKLLTTVDGIQGIVKIVIDDKDEKQTVDMRWCKFEDGSTGFLTSFTEAPIIVTEIAAEHFIRMVLSGLVRAFETKPGDLTIVNHLGESVPDVQFLPPTFQGNETDITMFVAQQDSMKNLHGIYEQRGVLNDELLDLLRQEDIVDDFLSLVQVRASGIFLAVRKPSQ